MATYRNKQTFNVRFATEDGRMTITMVGGVTIPMDVKSGDAVFLKDDGSDDYPMPIAQFNAQFEAAS